MCLLSLLPAALAFSLVTLTGSFGVGDAHPAGSATLRNGCTTVETTRNMSDVLYALPEGDTDGRALTLNFKVNGTGGSVVNFWPNNPKEDLDDYYTVKFGNSLAWIYEFSVSPFRGGRLVQNDTTDDLVSATESRGFTIERTSDGRWSMSSEKNGVFLSGKENRPNPVRFFEFVSKGKTTWVFNCTGEIASIMDPSSL